MTGSRQAPPTDDPPAESPTISAGARTVLRRGFRVARGQQAIALLAGLAWRGAAIAAPWAIQNAIDEGVVPDDASSLRFWCLVLVGLGLLSAVCDAVRHLYVERAAFVALFDLRRRTLTALIDADPEKAWHLSPGEVISRMVDDCLRVRVWLAGSITGIIAGGTLLSIVVLVVFLDPWLAVIAVAVVPLSALLAVTQATPNMQASLESVEAAGKTAAWIETSIAGVETVKGIGAEPVVLERAAERTAENRRRNVRLAKVRARWQATATLIPGTGIAVGLFVGGGRAIDGSITVGELLAFTGWMGILAGATGTLTARLAMRGTALAAAERLSRLIELPLHPAANGTAILDRSRSERGLAVAVSELALARGDQPLLSALSFDAAPGEWIALIGATGAGKSSLLRAIGGDLPVADGTIRLDDTPIADIHRPSRTGTVAHVPQGPAIVNGSIADALRRGAPGATDADLRDALAVVRLTDFVEELGGLDGRIGERGRTVSGGQRQRFALAAALLCDAPLLLLDDVTSALDEDIERELLDELRSATPTTTVIFATHRAAVVERADQVVDLTPFVVAETSSKVGHA